VGFKPDLDNQLVSFSALTLNFIWPVKSSINQSINQLIKTVFVGRRYTTRPGAPTIVSGTVHLASKIVPEMAYNVLSGTLSLYY